VLGEVERGGKDPDKDEGRKPPQAYKLSERPRRGYMPRPSERKGKWKMLGLVGDKEKSGI